MNAKPDLRLIGEQLDATAARQREVFADRCAEGDSAESTEMPTDEKECGNE